MCFYCAYRGDFGRLGHGNSSDVFTPQPIKALQGIKIKQIACGDSHCLAVTMDGEVQRFELNNSSCILYKSFLLCSRYEIKEVKYSLNVLMVVYFVIK